MISLHKLKFSLLITVYLLRRKLRNPCWMKWILRGGGELRFNGILDIEYDKILEYTGIFLQQNKNVHYEFLRNNLIVIIHVGSQSSRGNDGVVDFR